MDQHGVCVRATRADQDKQQIRFARLFGPLELPPGYGTRPRGRMTPELSSPAIWIWRGNTKPLTPANQNIAKGAERFHADSSASIPCRAKWSMLRGVECPPPEVGGDTLFVDLRAAL